MPGWTDAKVCLLRNSATLHDRQIQRPPKGWLLCSPPLDWPALVTQLVMLWGPATATPPARGADRCRRMASGFSARTVGSTGAPAGGEVGDGLCGRAGPADSVLQHHDVACLDEFNFHLIIMVLHQTIRLPLGTVPAPQNELRAHDLQGSRGP
ncbi:hypothetical protein VTI28DRAFT_4296 [Corynascus sepedonium]